MEAALRALADESRRTMLETLAGGPATAGQLAALLPIETILAWEEQGMPPGPARRLRRTGWAGTGPCGINRRPVVGTHRSPPSRPLDRRGRGDLRLGGEFRARFFASGWEGTGRRHHFSKLDQSPGPGVPS